MDWRRALEARFGARCRLDEPLGPHVAFRIGGPADALVVLEDAGELRWLRAYAASQGVPIFLLGSGANLLVADEGIRGISVRLAGVWARWSFDGDDEIIAGTGVRNARLVSDLLQAGRTNLAFLGTIPGTLGGALIMNAGAHGGEVGSFVESVEVLRPDGGLEWRPAEDCGFAYRSSGFASGEILTRVRLRVVEGDADAARAELSEMRARRRATQPHGTPNAGSIFKNPPDDFAARLIEACALKGCRIGGAKISCKHANFIVNEDRALARHVSALARHAQRLVAARFGVGLEWEVRRVGEWREADRGAC